MKCFLINRTITTTTYRCCSTFVDDEFATCSEASVPSVRAPYIPGKGCYGSLVMGDVSTTIFHEGLKTTSIVPFTFYAYFHKA